MSEKESEQLVRGFLSLKEQLRASVEAAQVSGSRYPHWSQDFARNVMGICTIVEGGAGTEGRDCHSQAPLRRATKCLR